MIEGETTAITSLLFARQIDNCACHKWWGGCNSFCVDGEHKRTCWNPAGSDLRKTIKKSRRTKPNMSFQFSSLRVSVDLRQYDGEVRVGLSLSPTSLHYALATEAGLNHFI